MSEFINLGDISEVKNGYAFKSKNFTNTGIPVIKIKNITPPEISLKDVQYVSKEIYEENKKYEINYNDILISMTGSGINQMSSAVGKVGRVRYKEKSLQNQRVGKVVIKDESKYNTDFLYYYLSMNEILEYLVMNSTGSANQANISKKTIENIKVPNVTLSEQKKVVNILSSFDDKIENNNAIIANLEKQAQAIFKSWFVDFEPFQDGEFIESELGRIPNNWTVVTLKEVSEEIVTGKTPPTKDPENYGNKMPFVTIPDMHNNVYAIETERLLSDKGIDTQSNKVVPKNSISVSCIATVGLVTLIASDSMTNQQINTVITKENISSYYVYNHLKTQSDYLNAIGSSGSTTKNVNKTTFSNLKMLLPSESILKKYHRLCEPIFEYILLIQKQNKKLVETRDTLLPKLMSGEIRVEEATEVN